MIYKDNEQIAIELKKLILENKTSQKKVAEKLGIKPQGLVTLFKKKHITIDDVKSIIGVLGYDLDINFIKKSDD